LLQVASGVSDLPATTITRATGNWDKHNQLGGGGSCLVYRGQLYGELVAVKRECCFS
jgi:hypothetical protein